MEDLKNTPAVTSETKQDERKPYAAPNAEIILLTPQEDMAAWDFGYQHEDAAGNRWALSGWGYEKLGDTAASAVTGTITPNNWTIPEE